MRYLSTLGRLIKRKRSTKPVIPKIDIPQVVNSDLPIFVQFYAFSSGSLTLFERVIINALIRRYNPGVIFEIGTFDGRTTLNMAANSPEGAVVYTLDLPRDLIDSTTLSIDSLVRSFINKPTSGAKFRATEYEAKITQLLGDTATFDFSSFYCAVDFVFIDGSHSYQYIKNDSEIAMKLRRDKKSVVLWHDYGRIEEWPGLTKALNELYLTRNEFGGLRHIQGTSFVILAES